MGKILSLFNGFSIWGKAAAILLLAALIASPIIYVAHLKSSLEITTAQLSVANDALNQQQAVNAQNLEELDRIQKDHENALNALQVLQKKKESQDKIISSLKWKVNNAPLSDDGPVANVLRSALTGLRGNQSNPRSKNTAGEAGNPPGAAHLPAGAIHP